MVLTVRPARAEDAETAAELLNAIIAQGGTTALETPLTAAETRDWFLIGPKMWCCHVAMDGNLLVGFQSVGRYGDLGDDWGEMGTYARLGQTQKGIGAAMFEQTKRASKALGLKHLNALIRSDNLGGLAYYSRMGFGEDRPGKPATLRSGDVVARVAKRFDL